MHQPLFQRGRNRLLDVLDDATLAALAPALSPVKMKLRDVVYRSGEPIVFVYFPVIGVISMVATVEGSQPIEVATVGNEGLVGGVPLFLGLDSTPGDAFAQVPGEALRMTARDYVRAMHEFPAFARLVSRFVQVLFVQVAQCSACNRAHPVDERCARWLLMTHDRVDKDEFPLAREFLAQMLGVPRGTVNTVAALLQRAAFIRYDKGWVRVLDRTGLESATCNCYGVIRGEYDALFGPA